MRDFTYPWRMRLVDGELCSSVGIRVMVSARCPHGVVDGDKPFAQTGPRCDMCRESWYALESPRTPLRWREAYCPDCGAELHITYKPTDDGNVIQCWSHAAGSIWCTRSAFPVRDYEQHFNFDGWGKWEAHAQFLTDQFMRALERNVRYGEVYGS